MVKEGVKKYLKENGGRIAQSAFDGYAGSGTEGLKGALGKEAGHAGNAAMGGARGAIQKNVSDFQRGSAEKPGAERTRNMMNRLRRARMLAQTEGANRSPETNTSTATQNTTQAGMSAAFRNRQAADSENSEPDQDEDEETENENIKLAEETAQRTYKAGKAIASGNGVKAIATALNESIRLGNTLRKRIQAGSLFAMFIALLFSAALDIIDIVGLGLSGFVTFLIKVFIGLVLMMSMNGTGRFMRKVALRYVLIPIILEMIPLINVLPIETFATAWAMSDFEKHRMETREKLKKVEEAQKKIQSLYGKVMSEAANEESEEQLPQAA
ncbi:MAG: hypothetical protein WCV86_01370 [Patescibacteria group bacterium]